MSDNLAIEFHLHITHLLPLYRHMVAGTLLFGSSWATCSDMAMPIPETLGLMLPLAVRRNSRECVSIRIKTLHFSSAYSPPKQRPCRFASSAPTVSCCVTLQANSCYLQLPHASATLTFRLTLSPDAAPFVFCTILQQLQKRKQRINQNNAR